MSCKLNEVNDEVHPKKDFFVNWIYNYIYKSAMLARKVLKKFDANYKANEVHK